jgi:hypothetical protein
MMVKKSTLLFLMFFLFASFSFFVMCAFGAFDFDSEYKYSKSIDNINVCNFDVYKYFENSYQAYQSCSRQERYCVDGRLPSWFVEFCKTHDYKYLTGKTVIINRK